MQRSTVLFRDSNLVKFLFHDFDKKKKIKVFKMRRKSFLSHARKTFFVPFAKSVVSGQLIPGFSLSYTQSFLHDSPGINNQYNRSMDRKPSTQPGRHIALSDQTGPDSLKKIKRKLEPPDEKLESNQPSWASCELIALRTIISA